MSLELKYSEDYFLTAGETDARGELPPTTIVERLIEIATRHANILGIGYARLAPAGRAWVLVGVHYAMERALHINETYRITTWIESTNRFFSERCFRFDDADGVVIGYARSTWAIIDVVQRRTVNLDFLEADRLRVDCEESPVARIRTMTAVDNPGREVHYTFRCMDLDFNGHVNSTRYIEHILNTWSLAHYTTHRVSDFAIGYRHECLCGQTVDIRIADDKSTSAVDIVRNGERVVTARIEWKQS